jgi:hypothetical protein
MPRVMQCTDYYPPMVDSLDWKYFATKKRTIKLRGQLASQEVD